jgi:class 3 adenylate cyclase
MNRKLRVGIVGAPRGGDYFQVREFVDSILHDINLAARLNSAAGPNEMVVSNSFYQKLPERKRQPFRDMEPIEARNIGKIRCWKLPAPQASEPAAKPARERS